MNMSNKELFDTLQIKNTKQRDLVLTFLKEQSLPLTAEEIYLAFLSEDSPMNLSTVYRTLEVFTAKGIVLKSMLSDEHKAKYEMNHQEHKHHLICFQCKKVEVIKGCPLEAYEAYLREQTHYKIVSHKLEIIGCCPECSEKLIDNHEEK